MYKRQTEIQDKKFVFVLQPDNTLKNTEIKVFKLNDGKYYYVTEGLKAGDKVVMEGVQNLRDGAAITPITPAEKEAEYQKALKTVELLVLQCFSFCQRGKMQ
mgnify:CR=1 FL=1